MRARERSYAKLQCEMKGEALCVLCVLRAGCRGRDKPLGRLALSRVLACTHAHMHLVEAIAAQVCHVAMVGEWVLGLACHAEAWRLRSQVRALRTRVPFGA